jgi:hypothetical protein
MKGPMSLISAMEIPLPKIVSLPSQRKLCSLADHPKGMLKQLEDMANIPDEDRTIVAKEGGVHTLAYKHRMFVAYTHRTPNKKRKTFRGNLWVPSAPLFLCGLKLQERGTTLCFQGEARLNIPIRFDLNPQYAVLQPRAKFGFTHGLYLQRERTGKPDQLRRYVLLAR